MEWYWIVIITIIAMEIINTTILGILDEEEIGLYVACGFVYFLLFVILYPYRTINRYNKSKIYYEKHNISRIQFLFGKRVKSNDE